MNGKDSCVVSAAPWPPEVPQVEMITIPKSEYDKLCEDSEWLNWSRSCWSCQKKEENDE